jgi:methyl-accepting chemotaxis protein
MMEQADELMNAVSVFQLEGESQARRTSSDRRIANNPMRVASKPAPRLIESKPAASKPVKVAAKSGADDGDWAEF